MDYAGVRVTFSVEPKGEAQPADGDGKKEKVVVKKIEKI
jgi:hypothetical protein